MVTAGPGIVAVGGTYAVGVGTELVELVEFVEAQETNPLPVLQDASFRP